jgi:hypothetical protein
VQVRSARKELSSIELLCIRICCIYATLNW